MPITRRGFLGQGIGAVWAGMSSGARAAYPSRSVRTRVLEIGYHEFGRPSAEPIVLLHGFPDDAQAYDGVAPILAQSGYRVFSVYLRGYGPTRFLDASAPRTAEQAAIGQDLVDFADALGLRRFAVCGYDWGCRAAGVAAAIYPERVRAAVLIGGYTIQDTITPAPAASPAALKRAWYVWYFNTEQGRVGLAQNRRELCRFMWHDWSPTWKFAEAEYDRTAKSFDNPDFVDCVIHSYRHRSFNAPGEARLLDMERRLALRPRIEAPTVILHGGASGFGRPADQMSTAERALFPRLVARRIVEESGHFMPREAPQAVAAAVLESIRASN